MSTDSIPANWFNTDFKRRVLITIKAGQVPSTQNNFPFLFNSVLTDLISANVQSGGEDIRFASESGVTEFNVEIEKMDTSATSLQAWSKIPSISNGTKFYMYYDNPTASFPPLVNRQAVWGNYSAVYHMNQTTGGTFSTKDSTGTNDGTPLGTPNFQVVGKIDGNINFDGVGDLIRIPTDDSLEPRTGPFTVSAWLKSSASSSGIIVAKQNRTLFFDGWALRMIGQQVEWDMEDNNGVNRITIKSDLVSPVGTFEHAALTYDGLGVNTGLELYRNGDPQAATRGGFGGPVDDVQTIAAGSIASAFDTAAMFPGDVDEVRISKDVKSADFIKTEFNNQSSPSAFYTIGPVEVILTELSNKFLGLAQGPIDHKASSIISSVCGDASLKIGDVVRVLPVGTGNGFTQPNDLLPRVGLVNSSGDSSYGIVVGGDFEGIYDDGAIPITPNNLALGIIVSFFW